MIRGARKESDSDELSNDINRIDEDENDLDPDEEAFNDQESDKEIGSDEERDEDGDNEEVNVIPPKITIFDLKTSILQNLFNREFENFERSLTHYKKTNNISDYWNQLLISFWLAVNEEAYDYACFIYKLQDSDFLVKVWSRLVKASIMKGIITEKTIKDTLK